MSLTEEDKDRLAILCHRLQADYLAGADYLWKGGRPEDKMHEAMSHLTREENDYVRTLTGQQLARMDERGKDPVLERVDAAIARGESEVKRGES